MVRECIPQHGTHADAHIGLSANHGVAAPHTSCVYLSPGRSAGRKVTGGLQQVSAESKTILALYLALFNS